MVNRTDTKALPKERPLGLSLFLDVITPKEEEVVLDSIALLTTPWERPILRPGLPEAKREMVCFGWDYITNGRKLHPGAEMPLFISSLRTRCAEAVGQDPATFIQAIVTRYDVGAGINWHRARLL